MQWVAIPLTLAEEYCFNDGLLLNAILRIRKVETALPATESDYQSVTNYFGKHPHLTNNDILWDWDDAKQAYLRHSRLSHEIVQAAKAASYNQTIRIVCNNSLTN